jgi:TonB-linked SusC/RagA family outer membrane protein
MDFKLLTPIYKALALWIALQTITGIPLYAQSSDTLLVKGVILNGSNQPVANVSVGVEGSYELPALTDQAGVFAVKVLSGDEWLNVVPTANYKPRRVFLNRRTELTVYLTNSEIESGDDQISILSRPFLKRDLVSAFSAVNAENILHSPVISVDQYMQGRVTGMHVVNRSGDWGSGAVNLLRGLSSLNANNRPLYIVDGFPVNSGIFESNLAGFEYNSLLGINTLDISQITVVKDPTVTAAYGSKASNGVVYISTLDPSVTETVIELNLRSGYSLAPDNQISQMNANQHKTLVSELLFSSGMREELILEEFPNLFLEKDDDRFIDYQHNTNWQDWIFGDAAFHNVNLKVKGGDEIARYGLSFAYINSKGVIRETGYDGYNLRFVSLLNIFTWLKMNAGVSLNYNNSRLKESGKVFQTNPVLAGLGKSPMLNPYKYDAEKNQISELTNVDELGVSNPLAIIENYEAKNNNFDFVTTLGFEATLKTNFLLHSNFGLNYNVLKEQIFMPNQGMELYYNKEAYNVSKASNNSLTSFYNNTYLTFNKKISNNHTFSSVTGWNMMNNRFEFDWALTKNAHENDYYRMLQDGTNNLRELGGSNRVWNWLSFYENLFYSYKDKYLVMASLSLDGSSRVGDNAANTFRLGGIPFGFFYAAGAAWRLSNEKIFKNCSALDDLKLRLSYGRTGNDDIGEANALKWYNAVRFRETSGLYPAIMYNDQLTYETVGQINGGIDLAVFGNRFRVNLDIYRSQTDNMLVYAPLEYYFGYDFRAENNGKMRNEGAELNLFFRIIDHPKFKWDIQPWYSTNRNKILEIKGDKLVTAVKGGEIVNMKGEQANSFYGFIFKGVYSTEEEAMEAGLKNDKLIPYHAGDAIFEDISGPKGTPDNIINSFDKTIIGSSMPKHFGGLNNTFQYKRWALNAFLQFVQGNEIFNYVRYVNESMIGLENQSSKVLARWHYQGHITEVPRAVYGDYIGNALFSDRWIEDGSYLRIKNITLSYTIPENFLNFRNAQFYVTASNVVTFSRYLGYDPEFGHSFSHLEQGIDYGLTPQSRQFIIGIRLGL